MTFAATVLTLFPEMFPGPLGHSLAGRALEKGIWSLDARDIRAHAADRHRTVDDHPAGGGAGMVLKPDVLAAAIDAAPQAGPRLLMSPRGEPLTQALVRELAAGPGLLIVCGRFEGVDERVIAGRDLREVSVGDYVLSGGEPAAMVLLDAVVRLLPGVMGKAESGTKRVSRTASSNTRTTPSPISGKVLKYRRFFSPAITGRSPPGSAGSGRRSPGPGVPTCGRPTSRERFDF